MKAFIHKIGLNCGKQVREESSFDDMITCPKCLEIIKQKTLSSRQWDNADIKLLHQNVYLTLPADKTIGECLKIHTNITIFALMHELNSFLPIAKGNIPLSNEIELRIRKLRKMITPADKKLLSEMKQSSSEP